MTAKSILNKHPHPHPRMLKLKIRIRIRGCAKSDIRPIPNLLVFSFFRHAEFILGFFIGCPYFKSSKINNI